MPAPSPPPPTPPLLVDPGENVWPARWFGERSTLPLSDVAPAAFVSAPGVRPGFDFGLPASTRPSPRGLYALHRTFWLSDTPPALPRLGFPATAVHSLWVQWRQLEVAEGVYDWAALEAHIAAAQRSGWRVGVRILTSRVAEAPAYLGTGAAIATLYGGASYDPADARFHSRYLALLDALRERRLCQRESTALWFVGYASTSWGDEYIGPHGAGHDPSADPATLHPHVRERLDGWARACASATRKVLMGGESLYGTSLGFGTRNGFVEHYWYLIPDAERGQLTSDDDPYLRVNESAVLLRDGGVLGEENEEYAANWASEWRTWAPGERGGPFNASAPPQGHAARYGPLASFSYRYLLSSLRILQMRVSYLLASPVVVTPSLYAYVALELGRTAEDAPDAWCDLVRGSNMYPMHVYTCASLMCISHVYGMCRCFLVSAHFKWGRGLVSNYERWLSQRAAPAADGGGLLAYPDGRMTQTPAPPSNHTWMTEYKHDWIAQRGEHGVLGFAIDRAWAHAASAPLAAALVKVSLFDVAAGTVRASRAARTCAPRARASSNVYGTRMACASRACRCASRAAAPSSARRCPRRATASSRRSPSPRAAWRSRRARATRRARSTLRCDLPPSPAFSRLLLPSLTFPWPVRL